MAAAAADGKTFKFVVTITRADGTKVNHDLSIVYKKGGDNTVEIPPEVWEVEQIEDITEKVKKEKHEEYLARVAKNAPSFEVKEVEVDGFSLVNISPSSGKLEADKTVKVVVENAPGGEPLEAKLIIEKKIEGEKDPPYYSLKDQDFKFNVRIFGPCKFDYEGKTYEVKSEVEYQEIPAVIHGEGEWNLDVKLFGNKVPKYEVKEITSVKNEAGEDVPTVPGSELKTILNSTGYLSSAHPTIVFVVNTPTWNKRKIQVEKTLGENSLRDFSEEELNNFKFYFKVNVYKTNDENESNILTDQSGEKYLEVPLVAKRDKATNTWTATTENEYVWQYGNDPYFTIEELDLCPVHKDNCDKDKCEYYKTFVFDETKTKEANGNDEDITVSERKVTGILKCDETAESNNEDTTKAVFTCKVVNDYTPQTGQLIINKEVKSNVPNISDSKMIELRDTYNFIVEVSGTFKYKGAEFNNEKIQIYGDSENIEYSKVQDFKPDENVLEGEETTKKDYDESKPLKVKVGEDWNSGDFTWCGEAPTYEVYEYTSGNNTIEVDGMIYEIKSSGLPQKGTLADNYDGEINQPIIVKAKNEISDTPKSGSLRLIKTLENSDKVSKEYLDSVRFTFKIKIDGEEEQNIVLGTDAYPVKYNEKANKYYWEYISPTYTWYGEEELKYEVQEIKVNVNDIELNLNAKTGVLQDNQEENIEIEETIQDELNNYFQDDKYVEDNLDKKYTYVVIGNTFVKEEGKNGKIKIKKELTENTISKKFNFTVKLTGQFYYGEETDENYKAGEFILSDEETDETGEWNSQEMHWYGEAPRYEIIEKESDTATLVSQQNTSGEVGENTETIVKFVNEPKEESGSFNITKKVQEELEKFNINDLQEYEFFVEVTEYGNSEDDTRKSSNVIKIKAGETWESPTYFWKKGQRAPDYSVEEINIPDSSEFIGITTTSGTVNGQKVTGTLSDNDTVNIEVENKLKEQKGSFKIAKKAIFNKLVEGAQSHKFNVRVRIHGENMEELDWANKIDENTYEVIWSLSDGEGKVSPEVVWYGEEAPTVTIAEVVDDYMQEWNWETPQYSNNGDRGLKLEVNNTVSAVVTNEVKVQISLLMDLGGIVWEDDILDKTGKETLESSENGRYDENIEKGLEGVEVYVYEAGTRNLAEAYKDMYDSGITYPVITSAEGHWSVTGLRVNRKYDVEFVYDGQTYEPTTFLSSMNNNSYVEGDVETYVSNPDAFLDASLAKDIDRNEVNERISEVYGHSPIDGNGNTTGAINGTNGEQLVFYESVEDMEGRQSNRVNSVLQTTSKTGATLPIFKARASTYGAGLVFPVNSRYALQYTGTTFTVNGLTQQYKALYEHCLHINLGLKKRKDVDLEATKDLYSAKVIIDGKSTDYKFNKLSDIIAKASGEGLNRIDDYSKADKISYQLGLYETDYYYRSEIYKTNKDIYDSIIAQTKAIGKKLEDTELKVYLTYKIRVSNNSDPTYKVVINSLDDYSEYSLGAPIVGNEPRTEFIDDKLTDVAYGSYQTSDETYMFDKETVSYPADADLINWKAGESHIKGSDGAYYNKFTVEELGIELLSGESKNIFVTYELQKDTIEEVERTLPLGNKSNIVEIANYTSKYKDTDEIAGKIDRDSAPSNVNIREYNDETKWFEDDSDASPVLNLTLVGEERRISGRSWEDDKEDLVTAIGNGIEDDDEALIGGLTTELVEKIKVPKYNDDGTIQTNGEGKVVYEKEYDFLWPTSEQLDCLGGKTFESLTGFSSTIETAREEKYELIKDENGNLITDKNHKKIKALIEQGYDDEHLKIVKTDEGEGYALVQKVGEYQFKGLPTGEYVVRFLYGNDKSELENQTKVTSKPAQALKEDGTAYYTSNEEDYIYTANYDNDEFGSTPAVYNGQDYKSTIYQAGTETLEEDILTNEYHNLKEEGTNPRKDSDARDSEYRRLEVIANSQTITNENSKIMKTANNLSGDHSTLYESYYMFADTAKINLNIENGEINYDDTEEVDSEVKSEEETEKQTESIKYSIKNVVFNVQDINFGLIERPENNLILDKEIKEIKLTTNDAKTIFDAIYNINYYQREESEIDDSMIIVGKLTNGKYLIAKAELDIDKSYGIDQLQAMDKNERKLVEEANGENTGTQNFRFINVDSDILQGTTIQITYQLSAFNIGEVDYTSAEYLGKINEVNSNEEGYLIEGVDPTNSKEIRIKINEWANEARKESETVTEDGKKNYGKYLGNSYYTGEPREDRDTIVTTKVRQLIDYVDNDAVFSSNENQESNHIWLNTSINELKGNGYEKERILDHSVLPGYKLEDKHDVLYKTEQRNNLILSVDDQTVADDSGSTISNDKFEARLVPYILPESTGDTENAKSDIYLTISKTVSSQDDADNLSYDNLAEIVKFENSVGRRDETIVIGNANPSKEDGEFKESLNERDASATELITFTPPTGIETQKVMKTQFLVIVISSLVIVIAGIVIIKKKVLK